MAISASTQAYTRDALFDDVAQVYHLEKELFGSGRLIGEDLILTARHVLQEQKDGDLIAHGWQVRLLSGLRDSAGWSWFDASVAWWADGSSDLALLKLRRSDGAPPCRPNLKLEIGWVTRVQEPFVRCVGFPRGVKVPDRRAALASSGRLRITQGDDTLNYGIDPDFVPTSPLGDWAGLSGAAVLLAESPDPQAVWIYGVARDVPQQFTSQLGVAALAKVWNDDRFRQILKDAKVVPAGPADPNSPTEQLPGCPYPGLSPVMKPEFFVGRTAKINELIQQLHEYQYVGLVGGSGSGKSSLVMAGVIPALRNDGRWETIVLRPGSFPLHEIANAFTSPSTHPPGSAQRQAYVDREVTALREASVEILLQMCRQRRGINTNRCLIFVDNWEELYTPAPTSFREPEARQQQADVNRFIKLVAHAASAEDSGVVVLIGVRLDFYDLFMPDRRLPVLHPKQQVNLLPMSIAELRHVIEEPARRAGLSFSPPELVDTIIAEIGSGEEVLPLLQCALQETWKERKGTLLTAEAYRRVGGVQGAIRQVAEETYIRLDDEADRAAARRLFVRLVRSSAGRHVRARIPVPRDPSFQRIVRLFEAARLMIVRWDDQQSIGMSAERRDLSVPPEETVSPILELTHEALIQNWPTLQQWLNENRDKLKAREMVLTQKQRKQLLRAEVELALGKQLLDDPGDVQIDDIQDFIAESTNAENARLERIKEKQLQSQKNLEEKERLVALHQTKAIEQATSRLLQAEEAARKLCRDVQEAGFEYAAVQLIDSGDRTIQTVFGSGHRDGWESFAKHTLEGDKELWDIQACIAMSDPPVAEVISGSDERFDQFIFDRFGHRDHIRVFAPILYLTTAMPEWDLVDEQTRDSAQGSRRVYRMRQQSGLDATPQVIGTIEAGYFNSGRSIHFNDVEELIRIAAEQAPALRRTTLEHVFWTVARSALRAVGADAACVRFQTSADNSFVYQETAGARQDLIQASRNSSAVSRALAERHPVFVPREASRHGANEIREVDPPAYSVGLRAEAAIPIMLQADLAAALSAGGESETPHGLLHIIFDKQRVFSRADTGILTQIAVGAVQAIRLAKYITLANASARRLKSLLRAASWLADEPDSVELLSHIAGYARNLFAADVVTVYEYFADTKNFSPQIGIGGRLKSYGKTQDVQLDSDSAPFSVLRGRNNEYADDAGSSSFAPRQQARPNSFVAREDIRSAAAIILKTKSETVGVMFVNYRLRHRFSVQDKDFAATLASTAAIAIRTRRLTK